MYKENSRHFCNFFEVKKVLLKEENDGYKRIDGYNPEYRLHNS